MPSVRLGNCLQLLTRNNVRELVEEETFATCAGIAKKGAAGGFIGVILWCIALPAHAVNLGGEAPVACGVYRWS